MPEYKEVTTANAFGRPESLLRERQVLKRVPVSRSAWWKGVKDGRYPASIKISPRVTAWRESDIDALIADLASR